MTKSLWTQEAANFDPSTSTARLVEASLLVPSPSSSTDLKSIDMRSCWFWSFFPTCSWPTRSTAWVLAQCCATSLARDSTTGPMYHTSPSLLLELQPSDKIVNLSLNQKLSKGLLTSAKSNCWTCPCLKSFRLISPPLPSSCTQQQSVKSCLF